MVVIAVVLWRRNVRIALFLLISVELSGLVTELAKGRPTGRGRRPPWSPRLDTSFPSGHALGLMVIVLAVLTIALALVRPRLRFHWRRSAA